MISFRILVKIRFGLLMYKLTNTNVPKPSLNLCKSKTAVHAHFTRQTHHVHARILEEETPSLSIELFLSKVFYLEHNYSEH